MGSGVYAEDSTLIPGPVGNTGAMLTLFAPPADGRAQTCRYHRLHVAFLHCGKPATHLLTKSCGARVPLCAKHALELRHRFDDSSAEKPRTDGSYGWPQGDNEAPLDLSTGNLYDREPIGQSAEPDFAPTAFAGGTSGGAGGGATFDEPSVLGAGGSTPASSAEIPQSSTLEAETSESPTLSAETPEAPDTGSSPDSDSGSTPDAGSSSDSGSSSPDDSSSNG